MCYPCWCFIFEKIAQFSYNCMLSCFFILIRSYQVTKNREKAQRGETTNTQKATITRHYQLSNLRYRFVKKKKRYITLFYAGGCAVSCFWYHGKPVSRSKYMLPDSKRVWFSKKKTTFLCFMAPPAETTVIPGGLFNG